MLQHLDPGDIPIVARPARPGVPTLFALATILVQGLVATLPAVAQDTVLSEAEERGQYIYETGKSRSRRIITADMQRGEPPVPAEILPCKNCHGADGRGAEDYTGVAPLNINWFALAQSGRAAIQHRRGGHG